MQAEAHLILSRLPGSDEHRLAAVDLPAHLDPLPVDVVGALPAFDGHADLAALDALGLADRVADLAILVRQRHLGKNGEKKFIQRPALENLLKNFVPFRPLFWIFLFPFFDSLVRYN